MKKREWEGVSSNNWWYVVREDGDVMPKGCWLLAVTKNQMSGWWRIQVGIVDEGRDFVSPSEFEDLETAKAVALLFLNS